mmetsp:Transcript_24605/g.39602  ORF Transcript_24605/g.39602 Transcript_24605/m.39602 type:complete len:221 (-) Transcript_24605:108-770(-)
MQRSKHRGDQEGGGQEEGAVVAHDDAQENDGGLDVHFDVHARVLLGVFEVSLHSHLTVHVKLPLFHVVLVLDDLVLVPLHALHLADVVLIKHGLGLQRVVRVEQLRAVAASLDPNHVPAGMPGNKRCDVVHLAVDDDPKVFRGGVHLDLRGGVLTGRASTSGQGHDACLGIQGRDAAHGGRRDVARRHLFWLFGGGGVLSCSPASTSSIFFSSKRARRRS